MKNIKQFGAKVLVLMMSIVCFGTMTLSAETDEPGPFQRLFRAIRHAGKESHHTSSHRGHKHGGEMATEDESTAPSQASGAGATAAPSERNTRSTSRAVVKKGSDFSYGTPVAGKPGLVTSPYSPNSGYIDVRGFAPGTPVKDPYTGKIFLTP